MTVVLTQVHYPKLKGWSQDAPFSGTTCAADGSGQRFGCTRVNQYYYQVLPLCLPNSLPVSCRTRMVLLQTHPR